MVDGCTAVFAEEFGSDVCGVCAKTGLLSATIIAPAETSMTIWRFIQALPRWSSELEAGVRTRPCGGIRPPLARNTAAIKRPPLRQSFVIRRRPATSKHGQLRANKVQSLCLISNQQNPWSRSKRCRLARAGILQRRRFVHHIGQAVAIRELGKAQVVSRHLCVFDL